MCWRLKEPLRAYERLSQVLVVILATCLALLALTHIPSFLSSLGEYEDVLSDPVAVRTAILSTVVGLLASLGLCYRDLSDVSRAMRDGLSKRRMLTWSLACPVALLSAFLALLALRPSALSWRTSPLLVNPFFLLALSFSATFLMAQAEIRWDRVVLLEVWPEGSPRILRARRFLVDALMLQGLLIGGAKLDMLAQALWHEQDSGDS